MTEIQHMAAPLWPKSFRKCKRSSFDINSFCFANAFIQPMKCMANFFGFGGRLSRVRK